MLENDKSPIALSDLADDDVVDTNDTRAILGGARNPISVATLYRGIAKGIFPKPDFKAGGNRWNVGKLRACRRGAEVA